MQPPDKGKGLWLAGFAVLAVAVLVLAPTRGSTDVPTAAMLHPGRGGQAADIFWRIRVPRTCVAFLAGAALAVSGMTFQAMFRNPLATPFTLGVSSGASLGAALYVILGISFHVLGVPGVTIFASLGALLSILLVYGLARASRGFSAAALLLAGVAVSFSFSSLILFLQYLSDFAGSFRILRWLMGGLDTVGFDSVLSMFPPVAVGGTVVLLLTHELNLLSTGDELATSRGVAVGRVKKIAFLTTSLMVGTVVAFCGPIGFVGMMAPHICRLLVGPNHRVLAPATLLFGGTFLVLCDTLARTVVAPVEIPVGIVTALLGGPFFLALLVTRSFARGGFFD